MKARLESLANWLNNWHVTRIFQALSSFLLILTLVGFAIEMHSSEQARVISAWKLLTIKAPGNSGKRPALEYLNDKGHSLVGIDLTPPKLRGTSGVYLVGAQLSGADLSESSLSRARLNQANLKGVKLVGASMSGVNLSGADLSGADLFEAVVDGARLVEARLVDTNLFGVLLSNSDLSGARLDGAILTNADLSGADLSNATMAASKLDGTNLSNTTLLGVVGLQCQELTRARNWQQSRRDKALSCD